MTSLVGDCCDEFGFKIAACDEFGFGIAACDKLGFGIAVTNFVTWI